MRNSFPREGWVEVICGSMFSGKSEELLRRLRRAEIAGQKVLVVKPALDARHPGAKVQSHDGRSWDAHSVQRADEILLLPGVEEKRVVAIDEAQFLDQDLAEVVQFLADRGKRVIVSGISRPETMTRLPRSARNWTTSARSWSRNWASSIATTRFSSTPGSNRISSALCTEWASQLRPSCDWTLAPGWRASRAGLTTNTFCPAISARRSLRSNSSLLPLNILPQITSTQPSRGKEFRMDGPSEHQSLDEIAYGARSMSSTDSSVYSSPQNIRPSGQSWYRQPGPVPSKRRGAISKARLRMTQASLFISH